MDFKNYNAKLVKTKLLLNIFILFVLSGNFLLSGCFKRQKPLSPELVALDRQLVSVRIFASHKFPGKVDYEHYVLNQKQLRRECGNVLPAVADIYPQKYVGAPLSENMQGLEPLERRLEYLSRDSNLYLKYQARKLIDLTSAQNFPKPGGLKYMHQGGIFEMEVSLGSQTSKIQTSLNSIANPKNPAAKFLRSFYSKIRSIGPVICESEKFYDIARIDSKD